MSDLHTEEDLLEVKKMKKESEDEMDKKEIEDDEEEMEEEVENDSEDDEEDMEETNSKMGMINAMVKKMNGMNKKDLQASYKKMLNAMNCGDNMKESREVKSYNIDASDISIQEEIASLFESQDLSEEFTNKATTIFEAAVVSKVNEIVENIVLEYNADLEVSRFELKEELEGRLNDYLDYVVGEWVEENRLAIERGVRSEMVEDFMSGLKSLFEEHYIDIPEEKVDVVESLVDKVQELENSLAEITEDNVRLNASYKKAEKEVCFKEAAKGLTDTQAEKLRSLSEGVEYVSSDDFNSKLEIIKEHYFGSDETLLSEVADDVKNPEALEEEGQELPSNMAAYLNAISKTVKK